jgi:hypothetical protein
MPTISGLISAISGSVVARMAAAGLPPLNQGRILLGRVHQAENAAPPQIVFIPMRSRFGPRDTSQNQQVASFTERQRQIQQRAVHTDTVFFEVRVWGAATPSDPDGGDFDITQAIYQLLILVIRESITGQYTLEEGGVWEDQSLGAGQLQKYGHQFVFTVGINTPVLDDLLPFAPSTTSTGVVVEFLGNSSESIQVLP